MTASPRGSRPRGRPRGRPDARRADDWLEGEPGGAEWVEAAGPGPAPVDRRIDGGRYPDRGGPDGGPTLLGGRDSRVAATRELLLERRAQRTQGGLPGGPRAGGPGRGAGGGRGAGDGRGGGRGAPPRRDSETVYRRRRFAAVGLGLVLLIGLWFVVSLFQPFAGQGQGQVSVEIPEGASISQIGDILERQGVINSPFFFGLRARLSGDASELKSGEFTLARDMSYGSALTALAEAPGQADVTSITIPEGLSRSEIAPLVEDAGLDGDYERATRRSRALDPAEYGAEEAESLEGFLFPASYELDRGADVDDLVQRQLGQFKDEFRGVDMGAAEEANLTPYDVLIIASMVEREAQVASERRTIAGVIYNRLQQGIHLGIDATTRFALDNWTEPLTDADFEESGAYNTRANLGLPPGPIGNPGIESIEAAANPEDTDFLYYVFKPGSCGEHVFTETLEEHEAAAAEYEAARAAEGGESPEDC